MTGPTSDAAEPAEPAEATGSDAGRTVATANAGPVEPAQRSAVESGGSAGDAAGAYATAGSAGPGDAAGRVGSSGAVGPAGPGGAAGRAGSSGTAGSADAHDGANHSTGRRWGRWAALFVGLWLLTSAWALATPLFGSPDEPSHAFRAAAVVRGELLPPNTDEATGGYGVLHVPGAFQEIAAEIDCYAFQAQVTANCVPDVPDDSDLVEAGSGAAKYNPVYYAATGWPSLLWTDEVGLFAMRIVSAGICSAFLASAVCSALGGRRPRLATVGVLVAATPMAMFLGGVVNPNSVEIAASISLWAAGLRLVTGTGGTSRADPVETNALWRRAGLAGSLMVLTRGLSPLWLAIIVLTCLLVAHKDALLPQLRRARVWGWITLVVASTLASAGWTLYSGASQIPATAPKDASFLGAIGASLQVFDRRMLEYVGIFGWTDTPAPALTVVVWAGLIGVLVVLGVTAARRRDAIVIAGLIVVTLVLPLALEAMQYNSLGLFWQSRYTLPVAAGIPILAAIALGGRTGTSALATRRFSIIAVSAMAAAHVLAFGHVLIRYQQGLAKGFNPLDGVWHPAVGSATVLALAVGGLLVLAVTAVVGGWADGSTDCSADTSGDTPAGMTDGSSVDGSSVDGAAVDGAASRVSRGAGANSGAHVDPDAAQAHRATAPVAPSATPAAPSASVERTQHLDRLPAYTERDPGSARGDQGSAGGP